MVDVTVLDGFYGSPLGHMARRLILNRLRVLWPAHAGTRMLGFGYAAPYLRGALSNTTYVVSASPAAMGVAPWPPGDKVRSTLVDEHTLPFADALFDRILVVHGLETSETLRLLLRELWRVLAPEGRIVVVAPNRASLWAQFETSPFSDGRPFTRAQLGRLLSEALFEPQRWDRALFGPPFGRPRPRSRTGWERAGQLLWPRFAGVHIVESSKSLYLPIGTRELRRVPALPAFSGRS